MSKSITQLKPETKKKAEQIAWLLIQKHGPERFAWLEYQGKIFFTVVSANQLAPVSPVTQLIQYLFDRYIDLSFFILRERIFTTDTLSDLCKSMVRLTAKRATGNIQPVDHRMDIRGTFDQIAGASDIWIKSAHLDRIECQLPQKISLQTAPQILAELIKHIPRGDVLHDYNRAIAAILSDADGNILSYSTNSNSKNKTLHAEVCLLQRYWELHNRSVPKGSVIYTSLRPCRMCADMMVQYCESPQDLKVLFLENDPGSLAQNTSLDRLGILQKI